MKLQGTHPRNQTGAGHPARPLASHALLGFFCCLALCCTLLIGRDVLPVPLSPAEQLFLQEIERRALCFFEEHSDKQSGLTRDRAPANGAASEAHASVAASGFALSAWCIAADHGWITREAARERCQRTLSFVLHHVDHVKGWIYHFIDIKNGKRAWNSEASTIDTALFLKGAIMAREYFKDAEISALVNALYRRIDWNWALNEGLTLSHGWLPESGFIPHRWDQYAEMLGLYLLGIGAPSNPLPATSWHAWRRAPVIEYAGRTFINCPPLFTHQYAHAFFDFRDRQDAYADYWRNSVDATMAQRQWCADQSARFPKWSLDLWGLTASDSAKGYVAWGAPERNGGQADGTVVPCAPGGSLPFAPAECLATLRKMREVGGRKVWGRYGFADAFNPHTGWVAEDVIAIDQGIMMLMAENLRSGFVWHHFMQAPEVVSAMQLAGFRDGPGLNSNALFASAIRFPDATALGQ